MSRRLFVFASAVVVVVVVGRLRRFRSTSPVINDVIPEGVACVVAATVAALACVFVANAAFVKIVALALASDVALDFGFVYRLAVFLSLPLLLLSRLHSTHRLLPPSFLLLLPALLPLLLAAVLSSVLGVGTGAVVGGRAGVGVGVGVGDGVGASGGVDAGDFNSDGIGVCDGVGGDDDQM